LAIDARSTVDGPGLETMKIHYYAATDSLYIDLAGRPGADSREVAAGVIADFDEDGRLVGIDIDHASRLVDLSKVDMEALPVPAESATKG
jgi:uncharacterized protein YuzE